MHFFIPTQFRWPALLGLTAALALSAAAANNAVLVSYTLTGEAPLTGALGAAPSISGNGRYVAFTSNAENFGVSSQGWAQVYRRDLQTGSVQLVSRNAAGTAARPQCFEPVISSSGRYVVFCSFAQNLVPVPGGTLTAVFLRDMTTNSVELIAPQDDAQTGSRSAVDSLGVSGDGRYVAFCSYNRSLVPGDTNGLVDVFVKDRVSGTIERVSVGTSGQQGNGVSGYYSISMSDDGRYVSFTSDANNLVPGDTNQQTDIFVRDRQLQTTVRASVSSSGAELDSTSYGGAQSGDGRYVVFRTFASGADPNYPFNSGVCVRDLVSGTTQLVSLSDTQPVYGDFSSTPAISRNGRWVAFHCESGELVQGDTNETYDVFIRDRTLQTTERVSAPAGIEPDDQSHVPNGPCISDNGTRLVFDSIARNLVPGDTNGRNDAFLRVRSASEPERVSVGPGGEQGVTGATSTVPVMSGDGQVVAFWSDAFNLVLNDTNETSDFFAMSRTTGLIERVNVASDGAEAQRPDILFDLPTRPAVSGDGRFIAFTSSAPNLVPDDTNRAPDIFVHDRTTGATERVSLSSEETEGPSGSPFVLNGPALSSDGRYVAFVTDIPGLVPGDTGWNRDLFVRDRVLGTTERLNLAPDGGPPNGELDYYSSPSLSGDGRYVVFTSQATNLVSGEFAPGVFIRDRLAGTTERVPATTAGFPSISRNGRYVVFLSYDNDLTFEDENGASDVFVYDRVSRIFELASITPEEAPFPGGAWWESSISDDGRYVAFTGYAESYSKATGWSLAAYRRDRQQQSTELVSLAGLDGYPACECMLPSLSGNGKAAVYRARGPLWLSGNSSEMGYDVLFRGLEDSQLAAPAELIADAQGPTSLRLRWIDESSGEGGFSIGRWNGHRYVEIGTASANAQEYFDTGLEPSTPYSYRIRACTIDGFSPYSNTAGATTLRSAPIAPGDLTATAESPTVVVLSWADRSDNESGFEIFRSFYGGPFDLIAGTIENATGYRDETAVPGVHYEYSVQAVNESGPSTPVYAEVDTPYFPPAPPRDLSARVVGLSRIRLDWVLGDVTFSYRVERKTAGTGFAPVGTVKISNTFTDTGVSPNVAYTYRVIGINSGGESEPSDEVPATVPAQGKLSISPKSLNFGTVKLGKVKRLTVKLKNKGTGPLYGEVGEPTDPYFVVSGGGVFTISPGQTRSLVIQFIAPVPGLYNRSIVLTSTAETAEKRITLTGRGK
jgi:Tol biopolymer transport system component